MAVSDAVRRRRREGASSARAEGPASASTRRQQPQQQQHDYRGRSGSAESVPESASSEDGEAEGASSEQGAPSSSRSPDSRLKAQQELDRLQRESSERKSRNILVRLVVGLACLAALSAIIWAGHVYVIVLCFFLQAALFRELVNVRYRHSKGRELPLFRTLQWGWFFLAVFYCYGDLFAKFGALYDRWHKYLSFVLYILVFCATVLSLRKGFYRYQLGQLAWTVVILAIIVLQMKQAINNVFHGLFWFVAPASFIFSADTFAYFAGLLWGRRFVRRPFIRLSPKKTWEGFFGGFLATLTLAFFYAAVVERFFPRRVWLWLVCPMSDTDMFPESLSCRPNPIFVYQDYHVPAVLSPLVPSDWQQWTWTLMPVQLHCVVLGAFASLVAPFGGFFASAIKRAYNKKDFDNILPGHGGMMDRLDCQFLMSFCTSVHYTTFVAPQETTVQSVLLALQLLTLEEQGQVLGVLRQRLTEAATGHTSS